MPEIQHVDVDGDRLMVTIANIPEVGAGVYFRTDHSGSSVPIMEIDDFITKLLEIAKDARRSVNVQADYY